MRCPTLDPNKVVQNISKGTLTPQEEHVLALGLNFAIIPSCIPTDDIITATEAWKLRPGELDSNTAYCLRLGVNHALKGAKAPSTGRCTKHLKT